MAPFANRVKHGRYSFGGQEHMLNDGGSHAIHGLLKPTLEVLLAVRTAAARAGGAGYTCPLPGIALPG